MKVKEKRKCDRCGELFTPRSSRQHYCRKEITKICPVCGDTFVTNCSDDERLCCTKKECKNKAASMVSGVLHKICKRCGDAFDTQMPAQLYCGQIKKKTCPVCGNEFEYVCGPDVNATCGNVECQTALIMENRTNSALELTRICKWCGKEFHPKDWRDVYCYDTHYKNCAICGKQFVFDPRKSNLNESNTCSKECMGKLMSQNHDYVKGVETYKKNMLDKYGVDNPLKLPEVREKGKKTCLEKYGAEWYTQTAEYKERAKKTNLEKYGAEWYTGSAESMERRTSTNLEKYGVDNPSKNSDVINKIKKTFLERYGVECSMQIPAIRKRVISNGRFSKLEKRIMNLFDNYNISYQHQFYLKKADLGHMFDFYLPDYKILIDADGLYYHSYMDDPDGQRVREDYDEIRIALVPEDHRFYLIIEGQEDAQVRNLVNFLESVKGDFFEYDSKLFDWCRSIEFPYPKYDDKRMRNDYSHLVKYSCESYVPQCRLGQSVLKNFHKSIYHSKVGNCLSPYDGWYDDSKLKKVIKNRFIYQNNVDPSKILAGFNISKICPCVSTFNPILAKYLTLKYLSEFETIFDPFSGFSGRLIGVSSTGKGYIGQDLNEIAVKESNEIIEFLDLDRSKYKISCKDILTSSGTYECLLTCPPYYKKEIYNNEKVFKSCDDWILECLQRFNCKRYVFVVDETLLFEENVKEELKSQSHLNKVFEYVIVISK